MNALTMVKQMVVVGLGAAILAAPMTWDISSNTPLPARVEAQPKLFKPPLRGAPTKRIGAGTRGSEETPHALYALVPENVEGLTLQEQPTLYWYLSQDTVNDPVEVTLTQGKGIKSSVVKEFRLDPPLQAGMQRIELNKHHVRLEPGKRYQWTVALIRNPDDRSQDIVSGGVIKRVRPSDLDAAEREQLKRLTAQTDDPDKAQIYLGAGIWYDGVSVLSGLISASPKDAHLRDLRASLCEQPSINLLSVASYDRQQK